MKKDGIFITQQVGTENDRERVEILLPEYKDLPYSKHYLNIKQQEISEQGFEILESGETFQPIKFFDTGALVWFAKIIEWEFPNFSVKSHLDNLYRIQEIIEANGAVEGRIHRFFILWAKKFKFLKYKLKITIGLFNNLIFFILTRGQDPLRKNL